MTKHKQIEVEIEDEDHFLVDERLEDVIKNFYHWGIETSNSCIDNKGAIWIEFRNLCYWETFLQLALRDNITKENYCEIDTLWNFLQNEATATLSFGEEFIFDPNDENAIVRTGVLDISVGLRFKKELLDTFKELFFGVLAPN